MDIISDSKESNKYIIVRIHNVAIIQNQNANKSCETLYNNTLDELETLVNRKIMDGYKIINAPIINTYVISHIDQKIGKFVCNAAQSMIIE